MENQQTDHSLSDEWREGHSTIPTIELANSLRSLKKLVGAITERNCEIRFNSGNVSYTEEMKNNQEEGTLHMRINPEPAFRSPEYPISGDNFDVLAGYAAHEAMHIRECSFDAYSRLRKNTFSNPTLINSQSRNLGITPYQIYTIGEEIYIDARGKDANKVIGQYIQKARRDEDLRNPSREVFTDGRQVTTFESLLQTWCSLSIYGRVMMPDKVLSLPYEIQYNLEILLALSARLSSGNEITPNQRADTYLQTFYKLKSKPEPPEPDEPEEEDALTVELDNQDYTYDPSKDQADDQPSGEGGDNTANQEEPKEEGSAGEGGGSDETKDRDPDAQHKPEEGPENHEQDTAQEQGQEEQNKPNGEQEKEKDSTKEKLQEPSGECENQMEEDEPTKRDKTSDNRDTGLQHPGEGVEEGEEDGPGKPIGHMDLPKGVDSLDNNFNLNLPLHSDSILQDEDLLANLMSTYSEGVQDLSEVLKELVGGYDGLLAKISPIVYQKSKEVTIGADDIDDKQIRDLWFLNNFKNKVGRGVHRAQEKGRMDGSRMYRGGVDRKVFKSIVPKVNEELDIVLLADSSASMKDNPDIYTSMYSLQKAIKKVVILGYNEKRNSEGKGSMTMITYIGGPGSASRKIVPLGGTPSGTALLSTATLFPKSLIIHFTDGYINGGISIEESLEIIANRFPKVYVVNIEYPSLRTKGKFPNQTAVELTNIQDFPKVLQQALTHWSEDLKRLGI